MAQGPDQLQPTGVDPYLLVDSSSLSAELSQQRIKMAAQAALEMQVSLPGFLGVTAFGSTARGEARPDSDVDLFILVEPNNEHSPAAQSSISANQRILRVGFGGPTVTGTRIFHPHIINSYEQLLGESLSAAGIETADILVLPINEEIISEAVNELLGVAQRLDSGDRTIEHRVPRNVSALFQMPISTKGLSPYIEQVIEQLGSTDGGQTAWRMIRRQVEYFEAGRSHDGTNNVLHRQIPTTLGEVKDYYSKLSS